jgi:epoxyqueuosine reductase
MPKGAIKQALKDHALELGFIAFGVSRPRPSEHADFFAAWLAQGRQAGMSWLAKNTEIRIDSSQLLENAASIISFAFPYNPSPSFTRDGVPAARYIEPDQDDYHVRVRARLKQLAGKLRDQFPDNRFRCFADTPPLFEREAAVRAGLGFVGKNTNLIVPDRGSYVFLGEIITDLELQPDALCSSEDCGDCTACLDACPTGALTDPYNLDANRCLSYLSIEHAGDIPEEHAVKMESLAGCDRCQEVCPHNQDSGTGMGAGPNLPSLEEFLAMSEDSFEARIGHTALARPGLSRIQRNARILANNKSQNPNHK